MIKLYQFPHSHFSEKARWAIGFKGLDFEIINLPRGKHAKITKGFGLPATTVPFIRDGDRFVQGSGDVLTYLDAHYPEIPLMPNDSAAQREILAFEAYLDDALGHHGRRYIYANLINHPALLKDLFMVGYPPVMRLAFPLLFPKIKKMLVQKLEITPSAIEDSRQILEGAFAKLNARLDGNEFLFQGQMTRADITAASLTAIFTWPPEHAFDFAGQGALPGDVEDFRAGLLSQRFYTWGQGLYRHTRHLTGAEIKAGGA